MISPLDYIYLSLWLLISLTFLMSYMRHGPNDFYLLAQKFETNEE